jgi:hypothetical protein
MYRTVFTPQSPQVTLPIPEDYLGHRLEMLVFPILEIETASKKQRTGFGSLRGQIRIADDFDAPLEDFKEYM